MVGISQLPPPTTPVSGSVTANAGTNLNTSALALEATQAAEAVLVGAVNETAPASDTASSGLNGRLQRIAQRASSIITVLAGGLPAALTGSGNLKTALQEAIPAGTNNIGDVDVLTLPAIPAGTNNIGDVDVLTLPADPLGANADAVVAAGATGSISAKLRRATQGIEDLKSLIVLAAGTNNIGDVDVLTLPADPLGANADAVVAAGATGSISAKLRRATQGLEDLKSLIVLGAGNNNIGDVDVASSALPSGASTSSIQTANGVLIGAVNETAPASDTASSGLNGRLQRAAQRLTSLIALLPAALGQGTMAQSFRMVIASDQSALPVASHAVTNAGTFAVQDSEKLADNAGFTDGTTKVQPVGYIYDEVAGTALTENDIAAARINVNRAAAGVIEDGVTRARYATVSAANALKTDGSAVTQPVSGTITASNTAGDIAHDGADSGNPVKIGAKAVSAEPAVVTANDRVNLIADLVGKLITLPYSNPENFVSGAITSAMTGTTSTSLLAAPAAGLRNYLTTITVSNAHATVGTDLIIQDGNGGTTLYTIPAAAVYGGATISFPVPLRQPATATALYVANVTTGASTKASAVGYKGV